MAGQSYLSGAYGKNFATSKLSKKLRSAAQPLMRFRQFTDSESQFGKRESDTMLFDKVLNLDASANMGAIIAEGQSIPRSSFRTIQSSIIARPSAISIGWTEELESFSEFDVRDPIKSRLVDYMAKALDYRAYTEFAKTRVHYRTTATTATGEFVVGSTVVTPTAVSGAATNASGQVAPSGRKAEVADIKNIIDSMKKGKYAGNAASIGGATTKVAAPVPPADKGSNYVCIASVDFCRAIKDDSKFEEYAKYGDPDRFFSGEIGRIYGCRIVEDNHILGGIGAAGALGGQAFFMGKEAVMEVVVVPEEIRIDIPYDFNRDRAMAFYYLGGFKTIWEFDATDEPENRIVAMLN